MDDSHDPRQWLEEIDGQRALSWVSEQNDHSRQRLAHGAAFDALRQRLLEIFNADDRIPYVVRRGERYYNLWRDAAHPRGLWRYTSLASFASDDPDWQTVLDLDALAEVEGESWVWGGSHVLRGEPDRCLIQLSRGGADAVVVREFDLHTQTFVEGGFALPEAKGGLSWIDRDHVLVTTDLGEGSLTSSGYPRLVKLWARGTPLSEARLLFEGEISDVSVRAWRDPDPTRERVFLMRSPSFYTNRLFEWIDGVPVQLDKPDTANATIHGDHLFLEIRDELVLGDTRYPAGSLLVASYPAWMAGERAPQALFTPTERTSLAGLSLTRSHAVLQILDNVRSRIELASHEGGSWRKTSLDGLPRLGQISAWAEDGVDSDALWLEITDYTTPTSLWRADPTEGTLEELKRSTEQFDSTGVQVQQHEATSADGTAIPYFEISPTSTHAGSAPTILYGYGGFEVSLLPSYSGAIGAAWLERGGVYVVANIRGGGEFGPRWHQAALRQHRHRAYEDFEAVGADLVRRGVTTPAQLGIMGGSNGGLLVGNAYTRSPERWGAVVCQVPLLDMRRYTKLLAGASWQAEYGDPDDPDDWAWLRTYSPYHNIEPDRAYPPILFTTSTRDDRVHPGHARKMASALLEQGRDVTYYENIEGGHGGAADNEQAAFMWALAFTFLWEHLARDEPR
ncbi:MAG TPA: S9 family peptidase [Deltaproteobacteria bacterium]|nr:S9 family peptidase [Deltaproteobacteria bacterium]